MDIKNRLINQGLTNRYSANDHARNIKAGSKKNISICEDIPEIAFIMEFIPTDNFIYTSNSNQLYQH